MEYSALSLPDLTVSCETVYSKSYRTRPQLVSILFSEFEQSPSPFFSGFEPDSTPVQQKRKIYLDLAVHLLTEFEVNGLKRWKHKEQRKVLEKAIRLLDKAAGLETEQPPGGRDVLLARGKAFLYRSHIIKPKGLTVPGKKIEALEKALKDFNDSKSAMAPHFKGLAALEMDRCGMAPSDLAHILENATAGVDPQAFFSEPETADPDQKAAEFYRLRIRFEELKEGDYIDEPLTGIFSFKGPKLTLEKLKVATRMNGKAPKTPQEYMKGLLSELERLPFSHPLWEDTVCFLRQTNRTVRLSEPAKPSQEILDRMEGVLKRFPIDLWKTAEKISRAVSDIHLRWYWSRQRDLYDLAFLCAVEEQKFALAARIADSSKSRPALTWQALEQMSRYKGAIKDVIDQYARVLGGGYVEGLKFYAPSEEIDEKRPAPVDKVDAGRRVIQFYLVQLKSFESGYAVICDENGWSDCKSFDFQPIWRRYLQWQNDYFSLPSGEREASAPLLRDLCEEMGTQLGFLFDFPEGTEVVFIPHDFLHRVPLHGAIKKSNSKNLQEHRIFLEKHRCTYWPALSYPGDRKSRLQETWVAIEHFKEKDAEYSEDFQQIQDLFDTYFRGATFDDFQTTAKNAPGLMAFFCHGKTNVVNPFLSRLALKDPLRLLDISTMDDTLNGASVFMGVCETDLMPSIDTPLDEHLSPAAAFINKKAAMIVSTMWEAHRPAVIDILKDMKTDGVDAVFIHQRRLWTDYQEEEEADYLHYGLTFKVYQHNDSM